MTPIVRFANSRGRRNGGRGRGRGAHRAAHRTPYKSSRRGTQLVVANKTRPRNNVVVGTRQALVVAKSSTTCESQHVHDQACNNMIRNRENSRVTWADECGEQLCTEYPITKPNIVTTKYNMGDVHANTKVTESSGLGMARLTTAKYPEQETHPGKSP